ncbi:MAG: GNAT family N-acetyltransferase [Oscillospiraceae bacterium]|nr:GNAT family N-acetyltransferase [Oscillospiraceae bacterium]
MIELARLSDRADVNRIARQVHALHVQWRPDLYTMPEELFPEDRFSELVKNRELYAAKLKGTVVGFVLVRIRVSEGVGKVTRKVMLIDQFCVDEGFRNHGIGTQMMTELRVLARAFGCTDLQLGVYPQNDAAVSFYQKCGFMIRSIDMQRKV